MATHIAYKSLYTASVLSNTTLQTAGALSNTTLQTADALSNTTLQIAGALSNTTLQIAGAVSTVGNVLVRQDLGPENRIQRRNPVRRDRGGGREV
jgi:hypothetical protein